MVDSCGTPVGERPAAHRQRRQRLVGSRITKGGNLKYASVPSLDPAGSHSSVERGGRDAGRQGVRAKKGAVSWRRQFDDDCFRRCDHHRSLATHCDIDRDLRPGTVAASRRTSRSVRQSSRPARSVCRSSREREERRTERKTWEVPRTERRGRVLPRAARKRWEGRRRSVVGGRDRTRPACVGRVRGATTALVPCSSACPLEHLSPRKGHHHVYSR